MIDQKIRKYLFTGLMFNKNKMIVHNHSLHPDKSNKRTTRKRTYYLVAGGGQSVAVSPSRPGYRLSG